tara:strand:- start:2415 stop:3254 length:840 start_codon:yes stop_codon:yes gene_type:complete
MDVTNNSDKIFVETLMIVICNNSDIYDKIIINYWFNIINYISKNKLENKIKIYLVFGKGSNTQKFKDIKKNIFIASCEENFKNILKKTVISIRHFSKIYNYKYLIRSNISSFWIIDNLLALTNELPNKNIYAGPVSQRWEKRTWMFYISGCGIIMSKDVVQKIIDANIDNPSFNTADDIVIKKTVNTKISSLPEYESRLLIPKKKIHFEKISNKYSILYLENSTLLDFELTDYNSIYEFINQNNIFHIRIKSTIEREKDIQLFQYLSQKFFSNKNIKNN